MILKNKTDTFKSLPSLFLFSATDPKSGSCSDEGDAHSVISGLFPPQHSDAATSSRLHTLHNSARVKYSPRSRHRAKRERRGEKERTL